MKIGEIDEYVPEEVQVEEIRYLVNQYIVAYMEEHYKDAMEKYESVARIKEQYERSIAATEKSRNELSVKEFVGSSRRLNKKIMLDIIEQRRLFLQRLEGEKKYEDYVIRDMEYSLDLEEARLIRQ
jgi:CPA1 family monovalent cation:H+ antiporter